MNKQASEYERVRAEALEKTKHILELPPDEYSLVQCADMIVDRILSIEGIAILADEQGSPFSFGVNSEIRRAQRVMQDEMLKAKFKKVI